VIRPTQLQKELAARDSRIKLVMNPSGKTAAGLNLAIAASENPVIVRVDGHAKIPNDYLSLAVSVLRESGAVNVGGVMAAEGVTKFEIAVSRAMRSALGVGSSRFHTGGKAGEVDTVYLGAFRARSDQRCRWIR
jgi:succinoglycan biosynthesis protein ExoA